MADLEDQRSAPDGPARFRVVVDRPTGADPVTVRVTGAVDLATAPSMAEAITAAAGASAPAESVLVDLTGVDFLGSAGLSVLVEAARRADESGSRLAIVASSHPVMHALEVTGLDVVLPLFGDDAAAGEYLAAAPRAD